MDGEKTAISDRTDEEVAAERPGGWLKGLTKKKPDRESRPADTLAAELEQQMARFRKQVRKQLKEAGR